jgi:hypothetical protein
VQFSLLLLLTPFDHSLLTHICGLCTLPGLFLRSSIERDKIKQFQIRTYQPAAPFQGKPIPAVLTHICGLCTLPGLCFLFPVFFYFLSSLMDCGLANPAAPFQGKPIPAVDSPAHNPLMMKESKRKQETENKA